MHLTFMYMYMYMYVFMLLSLYAHANTQPDEVGALEELVELWLDDNTISELPQVSQGDRTTCTTWMCILTGMRLSLVSPLLLPPFLSLFLPSPLPSLLFSFPLILSSLPLPSTPPLLPPIPCSLLFPFPFPSSPPLILHVYMYLLDAHWMSLNLRAVYCGDNYDSLPPITPFLMHVACFWGVQHNPSFQSHTSKTIFSTLPQSVQMCSMFMYSRLSYYSLYFVSPPTFPSSLPPPPSLPPSLSSAFPSCLPTFPLPLLLPPSPWCSSLVWWCWT